MQTRQIMTQNVIAVSPETSVADAARTMLDNRISGLPVIEDGQLVGIVTEGDFLRRASSKPKNRALPITPITVPIGIS